MNLDEKVERKINGICRGCGVAITKLEHSTLPTCRTNGTRYIYTNAPDTGWGIMACKFCDRQIDESFEVREEKP